MSSYLYLFSVIIPTYNRCEELGELLDSLGKQNIDLNDFEVIIVDDGSNDNTEDTINKFKQNTKLNITLFRQNHKGPGEARNLGMQNAKGKYFVFIDSDCIADVNWLNAYKLQVVKQDVAGFGGPDSVLPNFKPIQKAIDYSMTSFITTGGIRGHSKKKISKYYPRSFNMGVRADIVVKIGGMGNLRHGQDIEFSNRILSTGEPIIKVEDAIVYHKRRISIKKFFKQVFNWGIARINLYKIDPNMLEFIHFLPAIGTLFSLFIIIFSFVFPNIFLPILFIALIILFAMGIHAVIKYKDVKVFPFIPIIIITQIWGYGIGFIFAFIKRIIFKKNEFTGFVKKYY